jgi:hypothetical protein
MILRQFQSMQDRKSGQRRRKVDGCADFYLMEPAGETLSRQLFAPETCAQNLIPIPALNWENVNDSLDLNTCRNRYPTST